MGACLVALLVFGVVAGACGAMGGDDSASTSTTVAGADASDDTTSDTVERNGDPEFCAAIVSFQDAYLLVGEPDPAATPAEVEADWDALSAASGQMIELAPADLSVFVAPVVGAFDTLRQDADAVGYEYGTFDDLASAATIDPQGDIAQSAFALFTYGDERCPVDPAGATGAPATTATTVAPG